jgi:hypothetical protein
MFIDDDDISKPHELATYLKVALRTRSDVLSNFITVFTGDDPEKTTVGRYIGVGGSLELCFFINTLGASNIFVNRTSFESLGGYNENCSGYEDWEFGVRVMMANMKWEIVPETLYLYRDSPSSMMDKLKDNDYMEVNTVLKPYLELIPSELRSIFHYARFKSDQEKKELYQIQG